MKIGKLWFKNKIINNTKIANYFGLDGPLLYKKTFTI